MLNMNCKNYILAAMLLSLAACVSPTVEEHVLQGEAQGSTYRIVYLGEGITGADKSIDSLFKVFDNSLSAWVPQSLLSRLNAGDTIIPDQHFVQVWKSSLDAFNTSAGYFDPSVGSLVQAWGFGFKGTTPFPDSSKIESLLQKKIFGRLSLPEVSVPYFLPKDGIELDFNAIAQGYTVDVIADWFLSKGASRFMVEVGGEVRTAGLNKSHKPWRIGIDKPVENPNGRPLQVILNVEDMALATSGSYRKFRMDNGKRYSHAIDPFTGYPVSHSLLSVSVLAKDAATADAIATVFLILGEEKAMALAAELGLEAYFISDGGELGLKISMTPGFQSFILQDVFE
jgi:FAD:protein FMN transferase